MRAHDPLISNVKHVIWGQDGDPLQTNRNQLVICDTAHWGVRDFIKDKYVRGRVRSFLEKLTHLFSAEKILIVTTNKKMANIIAKWNLPREAKITWFRSDLMRGVQAENRNIMVCLGGPYVPKKAYVAESKSFNFEDILKEAEILSDEEKTLKISSFLRVVDTKSEFVNAIGRVKDPLAKERSTVFTLGMTILDVRAMLRQSGPFKVSRPHVIKPYSKGGFMRDALLISNMWLTEHPAYVSAEDITDLPILARVIRAIREKIRKRQKPEVRASEVVPNRTCDVIKTARRYEGLLKQYDIKIKRKRGGVVFILVEAGLNIWMEGFLK